WVLLGSAFGVLATVRGDAGWPLAATILRSRCVSKVCAMWPDRRLLDLFKIEHPILLGPMASAVDHTLAIAVAQAGGLGAIPCAMITPEQLRTQLEGFRAAVDAPVNVNFFCHTPPELNNAREARWRERLKPYYEAFCAVIEDLKP